MAEPRRWVVTGAAGFLGSVLVRTLIERGESVRAVDLDPDGAEALVGVPCERVAADVTVLDQVVAAFAHPPGTELIVVHAAGIVSIADDVSPRVREVNVGGTANVLAACRVARVARLVYVSSVHAIAEPAHGPIVETTEFDESSVVGEYAKTKAAATRLVIAADDVDRVVVHPTGIMGPGGGAASHLTRLVRDLAAGRLPILVTGGYDFVDVRDVAAGIIAAAERGRRGETYLLSGHYATVTEIAELVAAETGHRRRRVTIPRWLARAAAPLAQAYARRRRVPPLFTAYSLHTLAAASDVSRAKAERELGYRPRPLAETVADTVAWVRRPEQAAPAPRRLAAP